MGCQGSSDATIQNNKGYCSSYLQFCRATNDQFGLANVTPATVEEFAASLWEKHFTDSTINSMVRGVLKWCRWLETGGMIVSDTPFKGLRASGILTELKRIRPLRRWT
jgi:site-specific recombinase XerD